MKFLEGLAHHEKKDLGVIRNLAEGFREVILGCGVMQLRLIVGEAIVGTVARG